MKKCPPGVFCIEQYAMFFIGICVLVVAYIARQSLAVTPSEKIIIKDDNPFWTQTWMPSWPYTNNDPLLNPYAPPLRDERYIRNGMIPNGMMPNGMIPINVSTNVGAVDTQYRQVGIMTATNSKGGIVPLMGRPLFTNRDKWQYYTMSDQQNSMKLPISRNGKSCTNEYGCDKLYNGDTVYIEGINEPYRITAYDNDTIKYLPFV